MISEDAVAVAFATSGLGCKITHAVFVCGDSVERWSGPEKIREALLILSSRINDGVTVVSFAGTTILEWHYAMSEDVPKQQEIHRRIARNHYDLLISFVGEYGHKIGLDKLLDSERRRTFTGAETAQAVKDGKDGVVFTHLETTAKAVAWVWREAVAGVVGYTTRAGKSMIWRTLADVGEASGSKLATVGATKNCSGSRRIANVKEMTEWCRDDDAEN